MPFNGSGTYVPASPQYPAIAGTVIYAADWNAVIADIASALSSCLTKDGQNSSTANQSMGGFKITLLGNGTADTDAVNFGQVFKNPTFTMTSVSGGSITGTKFTISVTILDISGSTAVSLPANTSIGNVSAAELAYLDGLTSNVQDQIDQVNTDLADTASDLQANIDDKADLVGGNTFTDLQTLQADLLDGSTAVTQVSTDSSGKIATTAFVNAVAMNAALPGQNSATIGMFISSNGVDAQWSPINQLPLLQLGVY